VLSLSYRDATRFSDDSLRITSDYMYVGWEGWEADHVEYLCLALRETHTHTTCIYTM
jgi:hypothetical protein